MKKWVQEVIDFVVYASGSAGNLYTVDDGHTKIMIEMGLPIKEIKKVLNFNLPSYALLTHRHFDHSKSVKEIMKAGIDVFTSQGTINELGLSGHRIHAVREKEKFTIGTWTVLPLLAQHDVPEPFCYLMVNSIGEKILFATDTFYLRYRFSELKVIAIECNYSPDILQKNIENGSVNEAMKSRLLESHFSLPNVKKFLKANDLSKVEEIYLIHLSSGNSDEARFKREIQELTGKVVIV